MGFKETIEKHYVVHSLWTMAVLLMILAYVLLRSPSGEIVRDFISFAASIASLVLALVAIFYSIISNQSFSEAVGSLKETSQRVASTASGISDTSARMSAQVDRLSHQLDEIPLSFREISEKIDKRLVVSDRDVVSTDTSPPVPDSATARLLAEPGTVGSSLALYTVALSIENSKPFNPYQLNLTNKDVHAYIAAFLQAIRMMKPLGLIIVRTEDLLSIQDEGEFDIALAKETIRRRGKNSYEKELQALDAFFQS